MTQLANIEDFGKITKLSTLWRLALMDLRKVEEDRAYVVHMGAWHEPVLRETDHDYGKCAVCLAGAVMAKTFRVAAGEHTAPEFYGQSIYRRLVAIDRLRSGLIGDASRLLHEGEAVSPLIRVNTFSFSSGYWLREDNATMHARWHKEADMLLKVLEIQGL